MSGKAYYSLLQTSGGIAFQYNALAEADFAAAAGAAYTPPEEGMYRRNNVARTLQLLSECPVILETFQTSAATIRLPCNDTAVTTNDAGDGRFFIFKNAGTGNITIADYLGVTQFVLPAGLVIQVTSNTNNQWDFFFTAANLWFNNGINGFAANNVQAAIEETKTYNEGFPRAGLTLICNGTVSNNQFISYSELLPNTPIGPFPVKLKLNELMWSNTNLNVSFSLQFFLNGSAVPFYTYSTVNDADGMGYVSALNYNFAVGDYIKIKYIDQGTNCSDLALVLWVSRVP